VASRASFPNEPGFSWRNNRSPGCKVPCASNHLIVCVYRVLQMHGRALLADHVGLGKTIEACLMWRE
jgi:hypothetical protein